MLPEAARLKGNNQAAGGASFGAIPTLLSELLFVRFGMALHLLLEWLGTA